MDDIYILTMQLRSCRRCLPYKVQYISRFVEHWYDKNNDPLPVWCSCLINKKCIFRAWCLWHGNKVIDWPIVTNILHVVSKIGIYYYRFNKESDMKMFFPLKISWTLILFSVLFKLEIRKRQITYINYVDKSKTHN